ncbi:branched-chain amino acid aminotransferase [Clostridioides mangenotii]|uniref:branched-chain amino acid aminotransferase n=1 Tax=Metaclostridioides mangenotii TaxID=1540 RepID=UPI001C107F93|nr:MULTISPECIES: branched-chain amino acid aminotransferase [Clostridioides]MBS5787443.1 branched-chain amino acid aminotransferase [Clostridioides difficile]MBU5306206.1 branched-chain amino acid aminotransferase [Clostridioides mangenotii]MCR1954268.1 branched-chain amino acid aminotransferase [Clostridioides mangenotii]
MQKKDIEWSELGFDYMKTDKSYVSYWKDGSWDDGSLVDGDTVTINQGSTCLHYGQQCFEGLKAYTNKEGGIQLFRPEENALRMQRSCKRLLMPEVPVDKFVNACIELVKANEAYVPPYGTGATLYLRPYVIGVGENIGVRPAKEYIFGIFCMPVGPYYKGGMSPVNYMTTNFDRAAAHGTGKDKVGGNYAASLLAHEEAVKKGFADCIYLDPATHTKIDEVGAANFFAVTKDNRFVTPESSSILPSITKLSLLHVAKEYLGMETAQEAVYIDKLDDYAEAGACGTAAVITPIGGIEHEGKMHVFYSDTEVGPVVKKLYDTLYGIQMGDVKAPEGWITKVK